METHSHEINVGIDVGKSQLDAYVFEHQLALSCDNTPDGVHSLLVQLRRLAVTRIVIEASGRYERLFVDAALDQALPIVVPVEHAQAGRQAWHLGYHGVQGMAGQRPQAAPDRNLQRVA